MKYLIKFILVSLFLGITFRSYSQNVIQLEEDGGVYKLPCIINGLRLKLILDTGAANVCISQSVATMMLENDYLSLDDIRGAAQSIVADGRIVDHTVINIKKLQIGDNTLSNVEAIVIEGQSAPLLLGQSALKKLGRYQISGGKLVFGNNTFNQSNTLFEENLSDAKIDQLFREAIDAYNNSSYAIALEKCRILNNLNLLSPYGKLSYADCYYYTDNKEKALSIYLDIKNDIEQDFPQYQVKLYLQIGRSFYCLDEYDEAIPYLEYVRYYAEPWEFHQETSVYALSRCYKSKGNEWKACQIYDQYISQYLSFMEIKATDCWDKSYIDLFLAELFYGRIFCRSNYDDEHEKYYIIAAAWGNKKAIEYCEEFNISYSSKPYKYVY